MKLLLEAGADHAGVSVCFWHLRWLLRQCIRMITGETPLSLAKDEETKEKRWEKHSKTIVLEEKKGRRGAFLDSSQHSKRQLGVPSPRCSFAALAEAFRVDLAGE